jgi:hypothetical protein
MGIKGSVKSYVLKPQNKRLALNSKIPHNYFIQTPR